MQILILKNSVFWVHQKVSGRPQLQFFVEVVVLSWEIAMEGLVLVDVAMLVEWNSPIRLVAWTAQNPQYLFQTLGSYNGLASQPSHMATVLF